MKQLHRVFVACVMFLAILCFSCACDKSKPAANIPDVSIGDTITFGTYEQDNNIGNGAEPIEWNVLDKKDGAALLISNNTIDAYWYNHQDTLATWENCELRTWLNDDFYKSAFSADDQKLIIKKQVETESSSQMELSTRAIKQLDACKTSDNVYILTREEINQYLSSEKDRAAEPTKAVTWRTKDGASWWTRSPGTIVGSQRFVESSGSYESGGAINSIVIGVRPVVWIKCK